MDNVATAKYYDALAPLYDTATAGDAWTPNQVLAEDLARLMVDADEILDLGAGTGQTSAILAGKYPSSTITAVDLSAEMLKQVQGKVSSVNTICMDLRDYLETATSSFSLVAAIGCLEFVPSLPKVLSHLARITASGGSLCLTYELLIERFGMQAKRRNTVTAKREGIAVAGFTTYRHGVTQINDVLSRYGQIVTDRLFVAYVRGHEPVIYRYLRLERR